MRTSVLNAASGDVFASLLPGVTIIEVDRTPAGLLLTALAHALSATCPCCGTASTRVHSYYMRRPRDLPTVVFASHEWQALYCAVHRTTKVPAEAPTLHEAVRLVTRLGGFLARKGDGEPGVKTIWRGLIRLEDIVAGWLLAHGALDPKPGSSLIGNG